jgi:alpha-N-arabinofuranosidase
MKTLVEQRLELLDHAQRVLEQIAVQAAELVQLNAAATPLETEIHLKAAREVGAGHAIVLAGEPTAVNTIAQPANVAPKTEPLANAAATFPRTFPPYSVTLLRFPAKK